MAADPRVANGTPDAASVARSLPDSFLRWQIESRRAMLTAIAAGHMPRRFAAHLPVMVTFDAESPFAIRTATKGAGLTPRDEVLDRYIATLEEALARCADRPWEETLAQRVAAVRALLDRPEDVDPRRLAFLEIFRGRSYANLRRDGRVVLHYAGEGPET
ncbi:MAG: hypothetical protein HYU88_04320, partial [Chloroflexi bacterium]|nr:hypothetical protein [Chloroflexota bacterium]